MQKNTGIIIAIVTLAVGLGFGYAAGARKAPAPIATDTSAHGAHVMPDGAAMGGDGEAAGMAGMMAGMSAELEGKTGDAFDQAFISGMIAHHQGAVEMAELALANAKHQEIKDLANAIIAAQNREIAGMKAWQEAWYSN
jgi:uncharacterized protein (DUF305 family)